MSAPLLSSQNAGWDGIVLEHHYQPSQETPEQRLTRHSISIYLGRKARYEQRVMGRLVSDRFCYGDIIIVASDNNLNPTQRELLTSFGVTSQLLLPIKTHTNQMGAIVCSHCSGTRSWSKSEVELLKAVVDQLAIAIDQSQLYTSAHATAAAATAQAEELQQTLQKLQQTQVQLIQSAKMSSLGQMIAGIAHELNNPVTFIYGNVDPASQYAQSLLHLLQLYQLKRLLTLQILSKDWLLKGKIC